MVVSNTWIKLIDFGMAKRLNVDEIGFSTSTSTMVGTVSIGDFLYFFFSLFLMNKRYLSWPLKFEIFRVIIAKLIFLALELL